ncbi:synaptopodin 2-like protein [Dunckerocampus dactyliophorus]|uniref:synaptopodin 2-like protein n=1 Tax=Dunckerocampus dactyliophorus TaxID=161453 RepID=UPI002406AC6D|nr:synaptopodin 2-like protein [Dunckerocampus dactyliophorus]
MVAEEIVVSLSGGSPWGFRLQGGKEQQKPLQVAKVRRRSKACRAGLKEHDELVAIGDHMCAELSHAQAMSLIDGQSAMLHLRVKRASAGFHSSSYSGRSSPPRLSAVSSHFSPAAEPSGITSPPDSEAYYGETDSDADMQSYTLCRQRRTPPHTRSPGRYDNHQEDEMSEMSGYESANDAALLRCKDFVYQPHQTDWTTPPAHTPAHSLTPTPDRALTEAEGEGDSGFQEVGGSVGIAACLPLVSPERANDARMLRSAGSHLVPMVGPQQGPVSEDLSATYMDKARQAKLQRGESLVEKQVKEARTKCRSIASLLTDAPNPNSKGVLMFKKRRQRAKKYTLTCFGKAEEEDRGGETTEGETEEEGGSSIQSSEVDEEGFSASFDPTWDSGYLDLLDRRSAACPPTTPTTANTSQGFDSPPKHNQILVTPVNQSPSLEVFGIESMKQSVEPSHQMSAPILHNGGAVAISRASVKLRSPPLTPPMKQNGQCTNLSPSPCSDHHLNASLSPNASTLNRTARPFTPGSSPSRSSVTSVMFQPPQPKPSAATTVSKLADAVSTVTIAPTLYPLGPDAKRAVSSTSLYIPARNNSATPSISSSALSPPTSLPSPPSQPFPPPPLVQASHSPALAPLPPQGSQTYPSPVQSFSPPQAFHSHSTFYQSPGISVPPISQIQVPMSPPPTHLSPAAPAHPCIPAVASTSPHVAMVTAMPPQASVSTSLATREQQISVPDARTGILHDARRRSNKKPMFSVIQSKDVSPNPALMSMVQNMDDRFGKTVVAEPGAATDAEVGHESGPEEDWLRLGAEACNFMQAQRGPRPPPVAPKPHTTQAPQLAGKGGQLFARRQNRMDRYIVERSPSVAAAPFSPSQTREPSPTPSLPSTWKYSSNIRAPPPICYNPLLSPSCPPKAQKKTEVTKTGPAGSKGKKASNKTVDVMNHQPYQLNSFLFTYGGMTPRGASTNHQPGGPQKTERVYEVKRFSTPPPTATAPTLNVIQPRSATTLGEPMWRSNMASPPPQTAVYQAQTPTTPYQPLWSPKPSSPLLPPAPTAPLPQLPTFASAPHPAQSPSFFHRQASQPQQQQADRLFKSTPDLSPLWSPGAPRQMSTGSQFSRVPRPRFSTTNLGLQPCVWRPGSAK